MHLTLPQPSDNTLAPVDTSFRFLVTDEPDMTAEEARAGFDAVNANIATMGMTLTELYRRNAWRALGYASWDEAKAKEIPVSRSTAWRLLANAEVESNIGVPVPTKHAVMYHELPNDLQFDAYRRTYEIAGSETVGARHVRQAVDEIKSTQIPEDQNPATTDESGEKRVTGRVISSGPAQSPDEAAATRESKRDKWDRAMNVLRDILPKGLIKALTTGTLDQIKDGDVILWAFSEHNGTLAQRQPEEIREIERLVSGGERHTVRQALGIIHDMPTDKTRLAHMHNLAIAQGGATVATVGGAVHIALSAQALDGDEALRAAIDKIVEKAQRKAGR